MKVQICDIDKSPFAIHEIEVEGKFNAATINPDLVVIYVKKVDRK
jgi:hypothetical protein